MIAKYFWDLNADALRETKRVLKDPRHPEFARRMVTLLSRCDQPSELFSIMTKEAFVDLWPKIRTYWVKRSRRSDSRDWWETLCEQLSETIQRREIRARGGAPAFLRRFGGVIREERITKGLSQKELALRVGMKQPDISRIEEGKKNVTLFTLMRLCKVLGIKRVDLD